MPALTTGQLATLACLAEVSAPKVGNVHRSADFEDMTFDDFVRSAVAIGPVFENADRQGVGKAILQAVQATRDLVDVNTNLGTLILLGPLAAVPRSQTIEQGLPAVLRAMTVDDARNVYQAIRIAEPGGLGQVEEMDVRDKAPASLLDAMQLAADRDLVARQYTNRFADVLESVAPLLQQRGQPSNDTIVYTQVRLLARFQDSLIARKCGSKVAEECRIRATRVLESGTPESRAYLSALEDFDFWLRADGHRRNPGTIADLIAAGLFVVYRDTPYC